jgi:hypothetical protein
VEQGEQLRPRNSNRIIVFVLLFVAMLTIAEVSIYSETIATSKRFRA